MIPKEKFVESFYNFKLSLDNDALLMYNTKRGTVVLLESRQAKEFENYLENPKYDSNSSLISELKKLGFLIEPDANELNEIRAWHDKFRKDKRLLHITMLPSESCNFACPYCFQYQKRNKFMKDWVYEAVLNFIKNITLENQAIGEETYVKINWFGGEPLLQANKIINFHEKLKILSENLNLKYDAVVVTNGYLLNPHLMKTFVNLGIKDFQVTLDGNKDTHDSLRRLKNGSGTFDTIYTNLKCIRDLPKEYRFRILIRVNFLKNSLSSVYELIDKFKEDFSHDDRFHIYCRPVYDFETTRNDIVSIDSQILPFQEAIERQRDLAFKIIYELKYKSLGILTEPLPFPAPLWCPVERWYSYIFGADGLIFPCETYIGNTQESVGYIEKDGTIRFNENLYKWKKTIFDEENSYCLSCKLLPVCMGGCKRERLKHVSNKACYWNEEIILDTMQKFYFLLKNE